MQTLPVRQCGLKRRRPDSSIQILHLSDLHLDKKSFAGKIREDYLDRLSNAILELHHDSPFDLVVMTGDVADFDRNSRRCQSDILKYGRDFLVDLCNQLTIAPADGLIVVPGNHDYLVSGFYRWPNAFSWSRALFHRPWIDVRHLLRYTFIQKQRMRSLFREVFGEFLDHRWYPEQNLLAACFDSNIDDSSLLAATGYVDLCQFDDINTELKKLGGQLQDQELVSKASNAFRLALVHHHPIPIAGAENLQPEHWYERLLGRTVSGSTDLMHLRNSGHFLDRLLSKDFQLVLHGHLHRHNRGLYQSGGQADQQLVEIIAAGACLRANSTAGGAFNAIRIHKDRNVDGTAYRIDSQGALESSLSLRAPSYETIRAARYNTGQRSHPESEIRCDRFTQFLEVFYPSGDIEIHDVIEGLRCVTGEKDELPLYATALGLPELSEASASASCLDPARRVKAKVSLHPPNEDGHVQAEFRLKFEPPLNADPITVICKRRIWGVFSTSQGAFRLLKTGQEPTPEVLSHKVRWPCEQLLLRVRIPASRWMGEPLRPIAKSPDGQPAPNEVNTKHLLVGCNLPVNGQLPTVTQESVEGVLGIYRPRLGYRYGFQWSAPEHDPLTEDEQHHVQSLRKRLCDEGNNTNTKAFLKSASTLAQAVLQKTMLLGSAPALNSYGALYGFRATEPRRMVCVTQEEGPSFGDLRWGRDLVGIAFRRQEWVGYSRFWRENISERAQQPPLQGVPAEVLYLFAYPLLFDRPRWPIGVLVLASTSSDSGLRNLLEQRNLTDLLSHELAEAWAKSLKGVLKL